MVSGTGAELWLGAIPVSVWLVVSLICAAAEPPATHIRALWSHRERLAGLQQERGHQLGTLLGAVKWEDRKDKGQEVVIVLETQNSSETESLGLEKWCAGAGEFGGMGEVMFWWFHLIFWLRFLNYGWKQSV